VGRQLALAEGCVGTVGRIDEPSRRAGLLAHDRAASGFTALGLDPTAIYWNPAGLAMQDERSLLVQHGLLPFATDWDLAAVSYPIPGLGAVGMGVARVGTSGLEAYDENNVPLGRSDSVRPRSRRAWRDASSGLSMPDSPSRS